MTELDLVELGIWRIPIPRPGGDGRTPVNAWAIEDVDGGITLLDCGFDSQESLEVLACGLADAGATFADVRRILLSHGHPAHCGGVRRVLAHARRNVAVYASRAEPLPLGAVRRVRELRDGHLLRFRHFTATALLMPGHTAGLTCLFAEDEGILFSSDQLLHGTTPIATFDRAERDPTALDAYRESLLRLAALDVRVVLPGRGAPFAGHRRVVREVLSSLVLATPRRRAPLPTGKARASRMAALEEAVSRALLESLECEGALAIGRASMTAAANDLDPFAGTHPGERP